MNTEEKYNLILVELRKAASRKTLQEQDPDEPFDVNGWSGGNADDCYELGVGEGEISYARYLLDLIRGK